ncbi:MAG: DUF2442 domain-containing protein, partial [Clostridia bacterium]|nr:DUF2442 domain-containing protein [Clostridia bacterium]
GVFKKLKDVDFFNSVKVAFGTVTWGEEFDICEDIIYQSIEVFNEE